MIHKAKMSLISPKTIVITAYPGKQSSVSMPNSDYSEYSILDSVDPFDSGGPKKRRRLTHLTQDEKMLRRKLKNRVAAQTARDRKKALMTDLEEKVACLEDENKLLRKQNDSLRVTSKNLVDENKCLKSRLCEQSESEVKTESEASSTCYSSAEGTSQDFVPASGSVLHICGDSQHDNVLGLFKKEVSDFSSNCSTQTQTTTSSTPSPANHSSSSASRNHSSRVVGLSPAELESLNELIHIDHVYFKPQPTKQVVQTSEDVAHKVKDNESTIVSQQLPQRVELLSAPGSKRDSRGNVIPSSNPPPPASVIADPFHCVVNANATSSIDVDTIADDLVSSFSSSDSDSDSPLDLFESLGFSDFLDESNEVDMSSSDQSVSYTSNSVTNNSVLNLNLLPQKSNTTDNVIQSELEHSELDSQKLFDEIYDSYLSMKDTSSPESANVSDSGCGSDLGEAPSPHYSEGSLLDDYPWQDSFTDLFPGLQ